MTLEPGFCLLIEVDGMVWIDVEDQVIGTKR
jgi:hypothetical protein